MASPAAARQRAAMPFVHLERDLWDLRDATGKEIGPDAPERRVWLLDICHVLLSAAGPKA